MRKKRNILLLFILLFLLSACQKSPESFTIKNSRGETVRVIILAESKKEEYKTSIEEADNILHAYLGDSYNKGEINPAKIVNESKDSKTVLYGVTTGGKVYVNMEWYSTNCRELVRTIVHEELHFQNPKGLNLTIIPEKKNVMLSEYIVYYLTEKMCTSYNKEKYGEMYYGEAPKIPELDEYRDELSDVYLGRKELSKELLEVIVDVMRNN